jgi:flagellar hook-associated protein 3 FlgL
MRVTQNYSIHALLREVNNARERIFTLQRNLATGKRINQISDDPEHIEIVLRYQKMLKMNHRFEENINKALDFMGITSQALDDAVDILANAKEIAVQGADSLTDSEWSSYAEQVDQALHQLVDIANTTFKGRFVFGGTNTTKEPFSIAPDGSVVTANPAGIAGALKTEVGVHKIEQYNVSGQAAFQGEVDVFQLLIDLRTAFENHDASAMENLIDSLDTAMDQVAQQNANLGAKMNRFDLFLQQYQSQDVKLEEYLSHVQDTDVAQAVTDLQIQETGLQTALQVLARTVNISLVDFM